MTYRYYLQRAYALVQENPWLWLVGAAVSASAMCLLVIIFVTLFGNSVSWIEVIRGAQYPTKQIVLLFAGLLVLAILGRFAKIVLILHLVSQLRIKRIPKGFRRASDAAVVEPEDLALAGTIHPSLVRESRKYIASVLAVHGIVTLLLLLGVFAVVYPPLYMISEAVQVKVTITSLIGFSIIAIVALSQGMLATFFIVLYHRPAKVSMNISGDMLVMHLQKILLLGTSVLAVLLASGATFVGMYQGLLRFSNPVVSFFCVALMFLLWVGALQVFFTAVALQLFSDLIKPEAFELAHKPINEEASSGM